MPNDRPSQHDLAAFRQIARHCYGPAGASGSIEPVRSYNNCVARIRLDENREKIIKIARRHQRHPALVREPQVMALLRHQGLPVPNIEFEDLQGRLTGRPGFVMSSAGERTGVDLSGLSVLNRRTLYRNIAKLLAAFHSLPFTEPADFDGRRLVQAEFNRLPLEDWHTRQIEYGVQHKLITPEDRQRLLEMIKALPRPMAFALCHGDFNPAQCIRIGPRVAAVIDWEGAYIGDPLFDYAIYDVLLEIVASGPLADQSRAAYTKLRPLPDHYEQAFGPFKMVHAVAMMGAFHADRRDGSLRAARTAFKRLSDACGHAAAA